MTIDDIPVIAPYFRFVTTNTCDFTVGGMFMWRDYFHMAWQVEDGVLYSTLTGEDGNLYYNLPLGERCLSVRFTLLTAKGRSCTSA